MTAPAETRLHEIGPAKHFAGGITVRVVRAGWFRPDAGGFFGVVPQPLWSRFTETDERGRILCRLNLLLVEVGGRRLLVETGTGVRMTEKDRDIKGVEGGDPAEALRAVGEDPASIDYVVVTHLHYDHAGSIGLFTGARIHIQDREMAFATGRHMCTACIRLPFEADHVVSMVRALFADKVQFHDGEGTVAPGVTVHRVGGHSDGLQVVRVETARGPVVLASDAMHFYANGRTGNPFPIVFDLGAMTQGWRIARRLAGGEESRVIPGHDPEVRSRFPAVPGQDGEVVALHREPVGR